MNDEHHVCKSCGNPFQGLFCNQCGEKVILPKDRKLSRFVGNVMISTTIVDNKFIKSLRLTILRPGFLSREYVDGRRVNYMRPLQMFFILNLIYFLFPVLQMFNSSLYTQTKVLPHRKIAMAQVIHKIQADHYSFEAFALLYNEKTNNLAKLLLVIFVLLASLPLSVIFMKRNRYFSDHVALAVELTSFNMAVNAIGLTLIFGVINKIQHWTGAGGSAYLDDLTLTIIFVITNLYFLFRAASSFYNQTGKRRVLKAMAGILGLFLALEVYRFLLFFFTLWTL